MKKRLSKLWKENKSLFAFIGLMLVFRSAVADWSDVPTGSMKPTIVEGDRIFINKMAYDIRLPFTHVSLIKLAEPQTNDIIIFDASSDIYKIINVRHSLRNMTDAYFDEFLPVFCDKLLLLGFDNFIQTYNDGLQENTKDWKNLKNKQIDKDWINSTSVVGMNIIKRNMPHIYEVSNHKGVNIKLMWDKPHLEKALRANRKSHSTPYVTEIIRQLGFTAGTSKVTIYRPLLTKRIVESLNCKNVLDVCIGWGGRMLGAACLDNVNYTGIEPFSKTYAGLDNIKKDLKLSEEQYIVRKLL